MMRGTYLHSGQENPVEYVILDMRDCYTSSFPEFVPFCTDLFYFSSFKEYNSAV